jgi:hypothetical protein
MLSRGVVWQALIDTVIFGSGPLDQAAAAGKMMTGSSGRLHKDQRENGSRGAMARTCYRRAATASDENHLFRRQIQANLQASRRHPSDCLYHSGAGHLAHVGFEVITFSRPDGRREM